MSFYKRCPLLTASNAFLRSNSTYNEVFIAEAIVTSFRKELAAVSVDTSDLEAYCLGVHIQIGDK